MADHAELKAAAEAARGADWKCRQSNDMADAMSADYALDDFRKVATPDAVLALVAEKQQAEGRAEELNAACEAAGLPRNASVSGLIEHHRNNAALASAFDALSAVSPEATADNRDPNCVALWPECEDGGYDPRCCRFPKSCSCGVSPEATEPAEEVDRVTTTCSDGLHGPCSSRIVTNPSDGWHRAHYVPCECECHAVPAPPEETTP